MRIIDTYHDIISMFAHQKFSLSAWREYADSISLSLASKAESDADAYDMNMQVIPVIEYAMNNTQKLEQTHESFLSATLQLEANFVRVLGTAVDVDIVLYLGLCNGAGWATTLGERKTILLGIEKIIELDWCDKETMSSLLYHELGHIWHDVVGTLRSSTKNESEKSVWHLYQEGVAMYCEQLLCGNKAKYHSHDDTWVSWCGNHKEALFAEYIRRVVHNESTQDFFGDWCSYQEHSDVGYYLGCEFVKNLLHKYSLVEIANLPVETLMQELLHSAFS